ncbi:5-formyltetrahydrofolate cyclo-ligase [Sporosarcina sp. ACRSL]|uniref:5-formyltetrahydrofolate cyclo-ligase n=1 Tax=Sporosarcina sp. ACRSL TaxID=2918215 RepID=UPI001EF60B67|nr:5-formyltetrahydrofolate cyclo-ligase [Sporosarcina sp. ACRSL]MCG7345134.1 5-formyltetrahydrofolate cyclo-ligase [Sporosarcina sp. ACRSL]
MSKLSMRKQMIKAMKDMNRSEHASKSANILELLHTCEEYTSASTIGVTISRFPEVETNLLIESAWRAGKQVAVPKCIPATREMDFRIITSFDDLETVYMDLEEPIVERTVSIDKGQIDLQIVPGVVYSKEGFRIGFGGGYYDRYLTGYEGDLVSLAFDIQISQAVPTEEHDIPVNKIITENRVLHCREMRDVK